MHRLGIKYLLVDLNAATIDRDPRRALTTRYEHLLATMRSKYLSLVATDNICLRFALDRSKYEDTKDINEYLTLAGTNYHGSVGSDNLSRNDKFTTCANLIYQTVVGDPEISTKYPYLA